MTKAYFPSLDVFLFLYEMTLTHTVLSTWKVCCMLSKLLLNPQDPN